MLIGYHGTGNPDIRSFTVDAREPVALASLGAWFADDERVAEIFARWKEQQGGEPCVYEVGLEIENPRVYETYLDLQLDLALNPLVDARPPVDWSLDVGDEDEDRPVLPSNERLWRFRQHFMEIGHDGMIVENSTTDGGIERRDLVMFDARKIEIRDVRMLEGRPDLAVLDPREMLRRLRDEQDRRQSKSVGVGR